MAIMTSAQFADIVEPVLNDAFDGLYNKIEPEWSQVFTTKPANKRRFHEVPVLYGTGVAPEKPEGTEILEDAGGTAYRVRFVYKVYGISVAMTEELIEDGDHINMGSLYAEHMANSMMESKEIVHADIFNRAETAGYELGDGKTLLATDHPLAGGGTFSNKLSTAADFSEASLESLIIQQKKAVNERGLHIRLKTEKVVVPPDTCFAAYRVLRSLNQSGTANNDINALRASGLIPTEPVTLTRMTQNKAYFLLTDVPHGGCHFKRRGVRKGMKGDFKTDNMRYKTSERYAVGVVDPRWAYGSLGV